MNMHTIWVQSKTNFMTECKFSVTVRFALTCDMHTYLKSMYNIRQSMSYQNSFNRKETKLYSMVVTFLRHI